MKRTRRFYFIRAILTGAMIFICVMLLFISLISTISHNQLQARNLRSLQTTSDMAEYVRYSVEARMMILKGYESFVMTDPDISEETTLKYLGNLINDDPLIRNIGIIKNTTIIFSYPKEGNEKSIGVDIAEVPSQRDALLYVKNTLQPIFFGPVDLVQGGSGYISRMPIVIDGNYWGQISTVLKADKTEALFLDYAKCKNLEIAMFNGATANPDKLIFGSIGILDKKPVFNVISIKGTDYLIASVDNTPVPGQRYIYPAYLAAALLSVFLAWLVFWSMMRSAEIKFQASTDSLTQVHNRSYLEFFIKGLFQHAKTTGTHIGIVEMDIDHFKSINDNYGHLAGDAALKLVAGNLLTHCRKSETVFRMGGDEFLIVFQDLTDKESFNVIMKRITDGLPSVLHYQNFTIPISMSIGHAIYPEDGEHFDILFKHADKIMYANKKRASNKE